MLLISRSYHGIFLNNEKVIETGISYFYCYYYVKERENGIRKIMEEKRGKSE